MPKKLTYEYVKDYIEIAVGYEILSDGYKLLSKTYEGALFKLEVTCPKGHKFNISYNHFRNRRICPECHKKVKKIKRVKRYKYIKEFVRKYKYKLIYIYRKTYPKLKIKVQCPKGHVYIVKFNDFQQGNRCAKCRIYKNEEECREILERLTGYKFPKSSPDWLGRLELDGYCEKLQLAFECNGPQHYIICHFARTQEKLDYNQANDRRKKELCEENNIYLIIVPYWEWNNKELFILQELEKFNPYLTYNWYSNLLHNI